ncbi:MAG: NYN domain-containing protein [Phycisphaerales bacterium]
MPLIVDAYNATNATGALPPDLAGLDLDELCDLIDRSRYRHMPIILVADGAAPGSMVERGVVERVVRPDLVVRYAGPGRDADTLIEKMIRADSAPKRLIVVSTDQRVRRAATRRGARSMTSEAFLARLVVDRERADRRDRGRAAAPTLVYDIPLDPGSIDFWLGYFALESDDPIATIPSAGPREPPPPAPAPEPGPTPSPSPTIPPPEARPVDEDMDDEEDDGLIDVDDLDMGDYL